jgi:hypothetical protein
MSLQQIIDSAVNVEINRSKLVAQTISRSGRISVASRNWANPFRFTVTPKPVWTAAEYRSVFAELLDGDKYTPMSFYLNNISQTTFLATLGNSWMVNYQGGGDINSNNNNLDGYAATSATAGTRIILSYDGTNAPAAGTYIVKQGDYVKVANNRYPYIATRDVVVPTAASGITGTVQAAGTTVIQDNTFSSTTYVTTATRTAITAMSTTAGLSVGQILTKTSGSGVFGGITYIDSIVSTTPGSAQINIISTTACTSGSITFSGSERTSTPSMAIPIHRGYLGTIVTSQAVRVGARAAQFVVNVSKLPQVRYLPGQLVELTSDIELVEEIL